MSQRAPLFMRDDRASYRLSRSSAGLLTIHRLRRLIRTWYRGLKEFGHLPDGGSNTQTYTDLSYNYPVSLLPMTSNTHTLVSIGHADRED